MSGNKNVGSDHFIDDLNTLQRINLEVPDCERDMRVFVSADLKRGIHMHQIENGRRTKF